jgi:phthalate 4,5-cis-dihydrodiol dehydrogenase
MTARVSSRSATHVILSAAKDPYPLLIGVLGIGAARQEIAAIRRNPALELPAVADQDPALLAEFSAVKRYSNAEELCADSSIDAVFIGTPTYLHTEHALRALEAGKHVVVAKPMALDLDSARRMVEAAERHGLQLLVGHSQSYEPAIAAMRQLIASGELGKLGSINSWYFTDWIYRGRKPAELDTSLGGGVVYRQGAHHFDILRLLGGGLVRSVRAMAGVWDASRPAEGAYAAFLEFDDGAAATAVFNGYDHFHTTELGFPIGEGGREVSHDAYGAARLAVHGASAEGELALKSARRSGENRPRGERHQAFYGLTIVSCERGDIRQSPDGLLVYADDGKREVDVPDRRTGRDIMFDELYQAVVHGHAPLHNGRWGLATLEVQLAVLQSARERREVRLERQVSC